MRRVALSLAFIASGVLLSACVGGQSPSYVRGWNSNLDATENCSGAPPAAVHSQFEAGCEAAYQQWLNKFENSSLFGSGVLTIVPGNPKYKIAPIN